MSNNITVFKGKNIRDSIHGDIFFPEPFLKIIDTPEFQRLRRIHQLSVAYLVFPGADHTRFSHSIGTYYIMQKIIDHFKPIMKSINLKIGDRDINLALAAALLHDIGHGPLSHVFEKVIHNSDHEQWTTKIITDDTCNINRVLKKCFDDRFPDDLANIISKERSVKKNRLKNEPKRQIDLFFVLSGLISSQLDADRMDYLLRDSKYTGATFGNIDIERIIRSMTLTVYNNNYYVCISDKYITDIENYLLARYKMHKEVYLHSVKCEMEIVASKILKRAIYNIENKNDYITNTMPKQLLDLLMGNTITTKDYIFLDDHILLSTFSRWTNTSDYILNKLCCCIINREKYDKINILEGGENDICNFKENLSQILSNYGYDVKDYNEEYFWLESVQNYNIYKKKKDNIWIIKNDGTICDICDESLLIREGLNGKKTMTFLNYNIIKDIVRDNSAIKDIENLANLYDSRNHIEIEKKYVIGDKSIFDKVANVIDCMNEYFVDSSSALMQEDYYYDTDDKYLYKTNRTLRFRKINDSYQLTIKTPTKAVTSRNNNIHCQNERFEYEINVNAADLEENKDKIIKYLPELKEKWNNLKETLTIVNNRKKIKLTKNNIILEMVFDNVKYINVNGNERPDYQIEIELKSEYLHRINLKMLSDYLEENIPDLEPLNESKYKRGLYLTK
jgi:hypothetical protein